jgi:7-cyano-7-deazaguanine synthase
MSKVKAVVLFSGGQDSTTCLFHAINRFDKEREGLVHAVSVDYGQKHKVELAQAKKIAKHAGVKHKVFKMPFLKQLGDSALTNDDIELKASGGRVDSEMPEGLPTSFVPGRNIFLLTLAAAYAGKVGAEVVVAGMCQTDYSGYPDCRAPFMTALQDVWKRGLGVTPSVQIYTPLMNMTKSQTVLEAKSLDEKMQDMMVWEALGLSVTCYNGKVPGCGECPACELRAKGFAEAGLEDPQFL